MSFFNLPIFSFLRNGQQVAVNKDTVTPANSTPLPVEITNATGDVAINAANLNIEVQLSAVGANADSVRIGDGTDTLAINADGSINVLTNEAASVIAQMRNAEDLVTTLTYANAGTADERVTLITYTAASIPATTVTKTFAYSGGSGTYLLSSTTIAVT